MSGSEKMQVVAEKVATNMLLLAFTRVVMALGVPVTLAVGMWVASEITALGKKVHAIETGNYEGRMREVERQQATRAEELTRMAGRFDAALATLSAQQAATLRSVERIERFLDTSAGASRNGGAR